MKITVNYFVDVNKLISRFYMESQNIPDSQHDPEEQSQKTDTKTYYEATIT